MTQDLGSTLLDSLMDDDFDLDALLAESMQAKAKAADVKASRKLLGSKEAAAKLSATERLAMQSKISEWEVKREWLPVADAAIFEVTHCTHCASTTPRLLGVFQHQTHRHMKFSDRWIVSNATANAGLPKEVKLQDAYIGMCQHCAAEFGYTSFKA